MVPYMEYLLQDLMQDNKLVEWLAEPRISFDKFTFTSSPNFEVNDDYFKIVFRPVSAQEWHTFTSRKTENLIRAIAVMLANCRGKQAANTIFDAILRRTITVDIDQATGEQLPPRTLLNNSMLNFMLIMDRYFKLKMTFDPTYCLPDQAEHLEISYIQQLASSFLLC